MRSRSWIFAALWSVVACFIGADAFITTSVIARAKTDAMDEGRAKVAQAAADAETLLNRALLGVDVLLAGLNDLFPRQPSSSKADWQDEGAQKLLSGVAKLNLSVRDIVLVTEDGDVLAAALPATKRLGLKLPANLLKATFSSPVPVLKMSSAADNFVTAETVFYFARQQQAIGQSQIAAVAVVPQSQITAALTPPGQLGAISITLERQNGQLVDSTPPSGIPAERRVVQPIPRDSRDGVARLDVGADGLPALIAARTLLHDDLIVAASIPMASVLARWWEDRRTAQWVGALVAMVTLLTGAVTHWYLGRLRRARQQMEESKAWMIEAMASMRDGLLMWDANRRLVEWNERYVEFFPWARDVLKVGLPYHDLLKATLDRVIPGEEVDSRELLLRNRIGEPMSGVTSVEYQVRPDLRLHVAETRTKAGGLVSVFRDITSTERELRRAHEAEVAAEGARSEFAAAVWRRVSQPANNVLGMAELLSRIDLPVQAKRYVAWTKESATEILTAMGELAEVSKSAVAGRVLSRDAFRVPPALEDGDRASMHGHVDTKL
jgi:PAS domain-containing protein